MASLRDANCHLVQLLDEADFGLLWISLRDGGNLERQFGADIWSGHFLAGFWWDSGIITREGRSLQMYFSHGSAAFGQADKKSCLVLDQARCK